MTGMYGIEPAIDLGGDGQQTLRSRQVEDFGAVHLARSGGRTCTALIAVHAQQLRRVFLAVQGKLGMRASGTLPSIGFQEPLTCAVIEVADRVGIGAARTGGRNLVNPAVGAIVQIVLSSFYGGNDGAGNIVLVCVCGSSYSLMQARLIWYAAISLRVSAAFFAVHSAPES